VDHGVPVFIGTYEDEHIRGSARGIPEFHVFEALNFCKDLLGKFGGQSSWGLFSASNLEALRSRLSTLPTSALTRTPKAAAKIDAQANLNQINFNKTDGHPPPLRHRQPDPIFWTANVQVVDQQIVGKVTSNSPFRNPPAYSHSN